MPTMTMTNEQIAALAKTLVDAAAQKNLTMRALGGIAIYLACPSIETHPKLQRTSKDLDFVAARTQWDALEEIFRANGATVRGKQAAQWMFDKDSVEIELSLPDFTEDYRIDLGSRLALASPTLPLVDLLLLKLARRKFAEKDIQDSIALLLDHRVARGEAEDQIDHEYIAKLCRSHWSLFHTVFDNTVTLEKTLDSYLDPEEAQLVWRRIELLQGDMDQQPKSFGWMANQFLRKPSQVPR
jgi:hypothetical protein